MDIRAIFNESCNGKPVTLTTRDEEGRLTLFRVKCGEIVAAISMQSNFKAGTPILESNPYFNKMYCLCHPYSIVFI